MVQSSLKDLLYRFSEIKILCLGDVILDRFTYGAVERISPEAPVPVFRTQRSSVHLGGAGNVVRNLASLGVTTYFCARVGEDLDGNCIHDLLKEMPSVTAKLVNQENCPTINKTRYISEGQHLMRVDEETVVPLSESLQQKILDFLSHNLAHVDGVILSDYAKGFFTESFLKRILALAEHAGKMTLIDPKGRNYQKYQGATLLTPNDKELAQATALPTQNDEDVIHAARFLQKNQNIKHVLVTRGHKGMAFIPLDGDPIFIPSHALEVFDVSGAGDTVMAVLSAALAAGGSFESAAFLSNLAAGLVVAKVGTATITPQEILACLNQEAQHDHAKKILMLAEAQERVLFWHRQGLKVGFTNGCFDLLHPGHLSLLRQAKEKCDRLIVAVNSDRSVRRLKGASRPVHLEADRALILSALEFVDSIILFEEDTPLQVLLALKPDLLVKGSDYTIDKVVGANEVLGWGGEVYLADLEAGYSTTSTIKRLAS